MRVLVVRDGRTKPGASLKSVPHGPGRFGYCRQEVGEASGGKTGGGDVPKSRRGFGYLVRQTRARPSNTASRNLLSDDRYTDAVLRFLAAARVGTVKEGALNREPYV